MQPAETVVFEFSLHPADPDTTPVIRLTLTNDNVLVFMSARTTTTDAQRLQRILSPAEGTGFFARLRALKIHEWPANGDCCFGMGATWTVAMHDGKVKKRCYGVAGLEPAQWREFVGLLEEMVGRTIPEPRRQ